MNFGINFQDAQAMLRTRIQPRKVVNNLNHQTFSLDKDVFVRSSVSSNNAAETSAVSKSNQVAGITSNYDIGLNFGKDLIKLVKNQNADFNQVQDLIKKHINSDIVIVRSMSDYCSPNGQQLPQDSNLAAITRPTFDENGNIKQIELFIPEVNYSDENSILEFIDKTSHEITHVAQFVNKSDKYTQHYSTSLEGRFLNFVQKAITDRLTNKGVIDASKELMIASGEKIKTTDDYYKFMDSEGNITEEQIGELLHFGKSSRENNDSINKIFDGVYSGILDSLNYEKDPVITNLMEKCGGYDGLKALVRKICSQSFKNEQEAYKVGNMIRKEYNEVKSEKTYNDLINILMGMFSKALV